MCLWPHQQGDSEVQLKLWQLRPFCSRVFHNSLPSLRWLGLVIHDNTDLQHIKEDKQPNWPYHWWKESNKRAIHIYSGPKLGRWVFLPYVHPGFFILRHCRCSQGLAKNRVEQKCSKPKVYVTEQPLPFLLCRYSKDLVSKYATRKSPFKLWFLFPPPWFFFIILHVAITCWGGPGCLLLSAVCFPLCSLHWGGWPRVEASVFTINKHGAGGGQHSIRLGAWCRAAWARASIKPTW